MCVRGRGGGEGNKPRIPIFKKSRYPLYRYHDHCHDCHSSLFMAVMKTQASWLPMMRHRQRKQMYISKISSAVVRSMLRPLEKKKKKANVIPTPQARGIHGLVHIYICTCTIHEKGTNIKKETSPTTARRTNLKFPPRFPVSNKSGKNIFRRETIQIYVLPP